MPPATVVRVAGAGFPITGQVAAAGSAAWPVVVTSAPSATQQTRIRWIMDVPLVDDVEQDGCAIHPGMDSCRILRQCGPDSPRLRDTRYDELVSAVKSSRFPGLNCP